MGAVEARFCSQMHADLHKVRPFFVITGGPGSGKTTLLDELARRGLPCVPEDARALIRQESVAGGDALPWANASGYAHKLLRRSLATFLIEANRPQNGPVYFDRGIGDAVAYARMIGHVPPRALWLQVRACRYRDPVFLAPWWPAIYATDNERRQTAEAAEQTEQPLQEAYASLGYTVIRLPRCTVAERADFVLQHSRV